ncbi:uncharacterized protein LOC112681667 [Sipha flava]|uniref:Uncharacterized protein LOC112681667 n=1 Tax=Sipha flava TaxID=143950 RepID=A0A2S2QZW8_9HEMI|nr:uncharacterized protein LOC112681667 [Sipha flava]
MASTWWKIIVLQILITIVTRSAAYESDGITKLSNENIVWLFKSFLENLENQHATEDVNDRVNPIKYFYRISSRPIQNVENPTENEIKPGNDQEPTSENVKNVDIFKNNKRNYVTLCHFKICNTKRSIGGYDSIIHYLTQKYNSQLF